MEHKKIWTAALAVALTLSMTAPALGAQPDVGGEGETAPAYTVVQRGERFPVQVWGIAAELGEMSLTLERGGGEAAAGQKLVVNVAENTLVLNGGTGEAGTFADLQAGEAVCAWVDPNMTESLPPVSTAQLILYGIPADFSAPTYSEVASVREDGEGLEVYVNGEVVLHLSADTRLLAAPGGEEKTVGMDNIVPGTRLLAWYDAATLSLPAQATPETVMVFPSTYAGWVETAGAEVLVNGAALPLEGASSARVEDGRLMVPVRALAEALGCTVTWEAYTNQVCVSGTDGVLYQFIIGADQAARGAVTVGLVAPARAEDGVTFMALDDLIVLHGLKLAQSWAG